MKKQKFPIDEIKHYLEEGYTQEKIAKALNTSRTTIARFLKENNLQTQTSQRRAELQQLDTEKIIKMYQEGQSSRKIGKEFNIDPTNVIRILKKFNIPIRDISACRQIYDINEQYFNNIDDINKAYWLGFLAADGYTTPRYTVGLTLQIGDEEAVKAFHNALNSTHPIKTKKSKQVCELRISNKTLASNLFKYDIVPNKSLIIDLRQVALKANIINNEKYLKALLLGYFDGDEGIYQYSPKDKTEQWSCSITGTFETCSFFKEYFNNIGFMKQRYPKRNNNNWTYIIGGCNQVIKGLNKIYDIANELDFCLSRKKQKFELLLKKKS